MNTQEALDWIIGNPDAAEYRATQGMDARRKSADPVVYLEYRIHAAWGPYPNVNCRELASRILLHLTQDGILIA